MPPSYASDEVRMVFPFAYYLFWVVIGFVVIALLCGFVIGLAGIVENLRLSSTFGSSASSRRGQ
jgi:hypothetical protein